MTGEAYARLHERLYVTTGHHGREYGDRLTARCPAHDDGSPSLSIKRLHDRVLVHCFGGCRIDDILASLELTKADLFDEPRSRGWVAPYMPPRPPADPSWTYVTESPDVPDITKLAIYAASVTEVATTDPSWEWPDYAARNKAGDAAAIAEGRRVGPVLTSWRQVHASVSASVWARIWRDLCPATQAKICDLAPTVRRHGPARG